MPTIDDRITRAETELVPLQVDLAEREERLVELAAELEALRMKPASGLVGLQIARLQAVIGVERLGKTQVENQIEAARSTIEQLAADRDVQDRLPPWPSGDMPAALLPVRIETRFITGGTPQLLVRIFPDDIQVDSHEPDLTEDERVGGEEFWTALWKTGTGRSAAANERRADAREVLIAGHGRERAEWIVTALTPTNPDDRPSAAIGEEDDLAVTPTFPVVAITEDTWQQAPTVRALPDRWVVVGHRDGQRVFASVGNPIQQPLAAGLDPTVDLIDDDAVVDANARWIVDFDVAEELGMALRVDLSAADLEQGFDLVMAMGLPSADLHEDEPEALADLLASHQYTGGLSFLPMGVPTNNTAELDAGDGSELTAVDRLAGEVASARPRQGTNANVFAVAFGLAASDVAQVQHAADDPARASRAMNTLLWSATGGYFLDQFYLNFNEADRPAARDHFVEHVRGLGALPSIRIGSQPYALLPSTSYRDFATAFDGPGRDYLDIGASLLPMWLGAAGELPRASQSGTSQDDAEKALLAVLRSSAVTVDYRARPVFDQDVFNASPIFAEQDGPVVERRRNLVEGLLARIGADRRSRIVDTVVASDTFELRSEAVRSARAAAAERESVLTPSAYIGWLLDSPVETIRDEVDLPANADPPDALLFLILRHAVLLAYSQVALEVRLLAGAASTADRIDPSWVDVIDTSQTLGRQLDGDLPGLAGVPLHELTAADAPAAAALDDMRASLTELQDQPVELLEDLLISTLDTFSHRLDAWYTSVATRRLAQVRTSQRDGVVVGGFGWLENVRPAPAPTVVNELPVAEPGPLVLPSGNGGYVHAPSLPQAMTAAVIRSGHLATTGGDESRPFAIDLNSARVRMAMHLIEGVRSGASLGALLGYRFERMLHDRGLDRWIDEFRRIAPIGRTRTIDARIEMLERGVIGPFSAEARQQIAALKLERQQIIDEIRIEHLFAPSVDEQQMMEVLARTVVDGQLLIDRWRLDGGFSRWDPALPNPSEADHDELTAVLASLDDTVDAVSDLLMAESVHQLVAGTTQRTGESLDGVLRGKQPPERFEVVDTPRTGAAITHRLLVLLQESSVAAGWPRMPSDVIGVAGPHLDRLAGELLGDPASYVCNVRFTAPGDDTSIAETDVVLSSLEFGALEVLHLAASGEGALLAHFEAKLHEQLMVRDRPAAVPEDGVLHIDFVGDGDIDTLSFAQFATVAAALAASLLDARPLEPADLQHEEATTSSVDLGELADRADQVSTTLDEALADATAMLDAEEAQPGSVDVTDLLDLLGRFAKFGIVEANPEPAGREVADLAAGLVEQLTVVVDKGQARQREAQASDSPIDRLQAVLGAGFAPLAMFVGADSDDLQATFDQSESLQAGDALASLTWLQQVAPVRAGPGRLSRALQYCEVATSRSLFKLRVGQLPHEPGDQWAALPVPESGVIDHGTVSLVAHMPEAVDFARPVAGLLIDEWVEVVPSERETTGVAFHFDQPGTEAPNAVLLAVTPDDTERWDFVQLERILVETFDLVKARAVDPQALFEKTDLDLVLPAIYLGLNLAGDTVSTDLRRAK